MLRLLKNKRAQNTIEYALIIAVVIGAFTAMQLYNRRAINMRVKQGMDKIPFAVMGMEGERTGGTKLFGAPTIKGPDGVTDITNPDAGQTFMGKKDDTQYEPYYYAKGEYNMSVTSTEGKEETKIGVDTGKGTRTLVGQTSQRTGKQEITGADQKD